MRCKTLAFTFINYLHELELIARKLNDNVTTSYMRESFAEGLLRK